MSKANFRPIEIDLEAFEEGSDFGVRPVGGADEFALYEAVTVDDVAFRPHTGVVESGCCLVGVADCDQVNVAVADEGGIGIGINIDADGEDNQIWVIVVQLEQRGQFFNAGGAPGCPEVEQHHLAAIVGQAD